jgi:molecular chaperone DnaK
MAVVGIDLGTTNTVVACVRSGRVLVLADENGRRLLPSVVSFHPNGDVLVGITAKERRVVDAKNTIASVKRLIGRTWNSPEVQKARTRFAFEIKEGPGQGPLVVARAKEYTLPEISAFVLRRAKEIAERALGEPVDRAVITVPASFNELQRAATKVAGRVAGLDVLRIINEPTAAALAYGLGRAAKERIAIYDFGGGTFDCTLLDLSGNVFEVLATSGDSFLGGDDLDMAIAERMSEAFLHAHRYDPREDGQAFERLRAEAEVVKIELSSQERTNTKLREVAFGVGGAHLDLDFGMTRDELEMLATPLVERTFAVCQDSLGVARLPVTAFDKVILVGGSTRIPLVRRRVEQFFGTPPMDRVNPEEVVAIGAAIQAAALTEVARRRTIPPAPVPAARRSFPSAPAEEERTLSQVAGQPSSPERAPAPASTTDPEMPARLGARPAAQPPPLPKTTTQRLTADAPAAASTATPPSEITARKLPTLDDDEDFVVTKSDISAPSTLSAPKLSKTDLAATVPVAFDPAETLPTQTARPLNVTAPIPTLPRPPVEPQPPPAPQPAARPNLPTTTARMASRPDVVTAPMPGVQPPPLPVTQASYAQPSPQAAYAPPMPQAAYAPPVQQPQPQPYQPPAPAPVSPPPVLVDVTPRALVVETAGGWCDVVVPRNAKIPCQRSRAFTTASDMQTVVRVRIAQGEDPTFGNNTYLGEVELTGLRAAPRGEVTIQVGFELDQSGTLQVHATDIATMRAAHAALQLVGIAGPQGIAEMQARHAAMRVS